LRYERSIWDWCALGFASAASLWGLLLLLAGR
jgi:hypothetical protein